MTSPPAEPDLAQSRDEAGDEAGSLALYVHWPFCVVKCPYCDFNSHVRDTIDVAAWEAALLADLAHEAALLPGRRLTSIFFGGGTPSLMPPDLAARLIAAATTHWAAADDLEITLEANPNSVEAARFAALAQAGVNRLSLGLQSLDDEALRFLGRAHDAAEGLRALETAQRHVGRVNADFIYALPGDDVAAWRRRLGEIIALGTGHLSLYELTIEPGTRFAALAAKGELAPIDDETAAQLFELTAAMTEAAGIPAYEISNHARPGEECRHHLAYWRYRDYAGVGPGAHGRRLGMRTVRHRKPENFLAAVARNGHGLSEEALLDPAEAGAEALVMGLRLAGGLDLDALEARFGRALVDRGRAARLVDAGLLDPALLAPSARLRLTVAGRLLNDRILAEIAL